MDIVHHTLIGVACFTVAAHADAPLLGVAFVAGSVFPDLDVVFMAFGKRFYLHHHQGITHSLLLAPLFALLLAGLFVYALDIDWQWSLFVAALGGLLLHITLDGFNTYRIALLAPLSQRRVSLDAVFFIDVVSLCLTGLFFLGNYLDIKAVSWVYPLLFVNYFMFKLWLQRKVKRQLGAIEVIPGSFNPFVFYVLEDGAKELCGYSWNALTGRRFNEVGYKKVADEVEILANKSCLFRDMQQVARYLHITAVEETETGTQITAQDIAVRNFGGRFAKTVLRFDSHGKLIDEMAHI